MKINDNYVLREIAGCFVIVPLTGNGVSADKMFTINQTGAFLWKRIQQGEDCEALTTALINEFDVEKSVAAVDVADFVNRMKNMGIIE